MLKVIQKLKIGSAVGVGVAGILATCGSFAYAETATATYNLTTNVSAENELTLSLDTTSGVINLAPGYDEESAASSSVSTVVTIKTRNGYQLFMTGSPTFTNANTNENIPALSCANADGCTLTNNSWGYNIGTNVGTAFQSLADGSSKISSGTEDASVRVNFGVKVDYNTKPGSYTNTINFIALTDPTKVYMQFMQDGDCTETRQQVWDSRDETSYYVQRLKDGKCWMLDNLALDPTADNGNGGTIIDNMNSLNTNASDQSIAILKGGASAVEGLDNSSKQYASAGITTTWKQNFITGFWSDGRDVWTDHRLDSDWEAKKDNYTDNWTVPRINVSNINTIQNQNWNNSQGGNYGIGVYYNYCSASAGTYCYDGPFYSTADSTQNQASTMTGSPDTSTKTTEDICPVSWRLPTGGDNGEFRVLYQTYVDSDTSSNNSIAFKTALSLPLSAEVNFSTGTVDNSLIGTRGRWWASTRNNMNGMNVMYVGESFVYPDSNGSRSNGFNIRCVLR